MAPSRGDGALQVNLARRNALFAVSGKRGLYPQLFRRRGGGGGGQVEFVGGGGEELRWLAEASSIPAEQQQEGGASSASSSSLDGIFECPAASAAGVAALAAAGGRLDGSDAPAARCSTRLPSALQHAARGPPGAAGAGPVGTEGGPVWLRRQAANYGAGLAAGSGPVSPALKQGPAGAKRVAALFQGVVWNGGSGGSGGGEGPKTLQVLCVRKIATHFLNPYDILTVLELANMINERALLEPALAYFQMVLPMLLERAGGDDTELKAAVAPEIWAAMLAELTDTKEAMARLAYARAGRVLHTHPVEADMPAPTPEPEPVPEPEAAMREALQRATVGQVPRERDTPAVSGVTSVGVLESSSLGLAEEERPQQPQPQQQEQPQRWFVVGRRCLVRAGAALDSEVVDPPLPTGTRVSVVGQAEAGGRVRLQLAGGCGWVSAVDGRGRQLLVPTDEHVGTIVHALGVGGDGGGGGGGCSGGEKGGEGSRRGARFGARWTVQMCPQPDGNCRVRLRAPAAGGGGGEMKHDGPAAGPERKAAVWALRDPRLLAALLPYPPEWTACVVAAELGLKPARVCQAVTHARNGFTADRAAQSLVYFVLHKPAGCVCQRSPVDPTVYAALPAGFPAVPAVGRLDRDTEGLLLFTEDFALGHALIAGGDALAGGGKWAAKHRPAGKRPPPKARKVYHVEVAGLFEVAPAAQLKLLREPIKIDGKATAPAEARLLPPAEAPLAAGLAAGRGESDRPSLRWVEVTIGEGRNRQVRRLCERAGLGVSRLVRVAVGPLQLGALPVGICSGQCCQSAGGLPPHPMLRTLLVAPRSTMAVAPAQVGAARPLTAAELDAAYATAGLEGPRPAAIPLPWASPAGAPLSEADKLARVVWAVLADPVSPGRAATRREGGGGGGAEASVR